MIADAPDPDRPRCCPRPADPGLRVQDARAGRTATARDERGWSHDPLRGHTSRPGITALVNWSTVGDSAILHDQALPWAKDVRLDAAAGLVGINATSSDGGRIACKLFVDGKQIKANESDGTVNCSTTVG